MFQSAYEKNERDIFNDKPDQNSVGSGCKACRNVQFVATISYNGTIF